MSGPCSASGRALYPSRSALSSTATASANDNPTAVNDAFTVTEDAVGATLNVLANDLIAPDTNETLTVLSFSGLSGGGTLTIPAAKTGLLYTPAANFFGTETFNYTISDGHGGTSTATVSVTVTAANDPPAAQDDLFKRRSILIRNSSRLNGFAR